MRDKTYHAYLDSHERQIVIHSLALLTAPYVSGGIVDIHGALQAIGLALLVLFFVVGVMRTCGDFAQVKKPEHALKLFIRFVLAKGAVTYGLELMMVLFKIVQGVISTIMKAAGFGAAQKTVLPAEIVTAAFLRAYRSGRPRLSAGCSSRCCRSL